MPSTSNPEIQGFGRHLQQGLARTQMPQTQLENPSAGHPDPDMLAAFAEHTLSHRERSQIFEHLAVCGVCREVVALTAPEIELAVQSPAGSQASGKWRRFFSQWSWVPLSAGSIALLVVVGISLKNPHPGPSHSGTSKDQQTASMFDKSSQMQHAAKPDNGQTIRAAQAVVSPQSSVSSHQIANAPAQANELAKIQALDELQKSELKKKEANATSGVGGTVTNNLYAADRDESRIREMNLEGRRAATYSYSVNGNAVASTPVVSTGTVAAPAPPVVQSNSAQPTAVTAEENVSAFTDLDAGLNRLPHEKDGDKVQAKQVYPPRSSAMAGGYQTEVLDGSAPVAKTTRNKRELDQLASAGPQERPTPGLAFATGTPLWTVQNGQLVQSKVQDTEQNTQMLHRSSSSAIFQKNVVQLPGNEVALKVAQLGTVLFVVAQNGVMKVSRDNGGSWKDVSGPWQGPLKNVYTIGTLVYAETATNETWTSSDQGTAWTQVKSEDVKPQNSKP